MTLTTVISQMYSTFFETLYNAMILYQYPQEVNDTENDCNTSVNNEYAEFCF